MKCPHCRHAITVRQSFEIMNPWRFDCSACTTTLSVGPRGEWFAALVALAGAAPGLLFGYLWLVQQLPLATNLSWSVLLFGALILPVLWLAVRYGDLRRAGA
jgi:hypothetical protein